MVTGVKTNMMSSKLFPTWKSSYYECYRYDFRRLPLEDVNFFINYNYSESYIHLIGRTAHSTKIISSHLLT